MSQGKITGHESDSAISMRRIIDCEFDDMSLNWQASLRGHLTLAQFKRTN